MFLRLWPELATSRQPQGLGCVCKVANHWFRAAMASFSCSWLAWRPPASEAEPSRYSVASCTRFTFSCSSTSRLPYLRQGCKRDQHLLHLQVSLLAELRARL